MIEIKLIKKIDLEGYTLIEGFPGIGLVGPMAISYMVDKLDVDYCGYIESDKFPPLVSIHKGKPMPPVRLYVSKKNKFVFIFAEFSIPVDLVFELSESISKFVVANKLDRIISIGGTPYPKDVTNSNEKDKNLIFGIASSDSLTKEIEKAGVESINEGVASGISALLLSNSMTKGINDLTLLVPVNPEIIDPKYAEVAIMAINKLLHLDIDITDLEKEAQSVEAKIKDLIKKNKETHETLKKVTDATGPSMYA